MGVTLQTYRIRIGTYNPSVRVKTGKDQTGMISSINYWSFKIGVFLFLSLTFSILMGTTVPGTQGTSPTTPPVPPTSSLSYLRGLQSPTLTHIIHGPLLTSSVLNFYARMNGNRA